MKVKGLCVVVVLLLLAGSAFSQSKSPAKGTDPITGVWTGLPEGVVFDLKYDGKGTVTGSMTPQPGAITKGAFNPKTGALKLEGDTSGPDGKPCHFVVEGKLEKGTAAGVATCGTTKVADFKMTRK